jgi:hypothetical protein
VVDGPPPVERGFARVVDTRLFVVLAALSAVAAAAGYPYVQAFAEQGAGSEVLRRLPAAVALVLLSLTTLAVALPFIVIGLRLGPSLGLGAPLLAHALGGPAPARPARETVRIAVLVGLALGAVIAASDLLPFADLEERLVRAGRSVPESPPAWTGVLVSFSAGVSEELVLRFGLFTLVAWLAARVARRSHDPAIPPPAAAFHVANVVAALVFGALHFSNADAIGLPLDATVVAFVLVLNGLVGLACGWLYWKRGLEAAMIAHATTDLVIKALGHALVPGS